MKLNQRLAATFIACVLKSASAHSICAHVHVSTGTYQPDMYVLRITCTYRSFYITANSMNGMNVVDSAKDFTSLPFALFAPVEKL